MAPEDTKIISCPAFFRSDSTFTSSSTWPAAVGQCELMYTYDKLFAQYNHTVAQILLTGEDVDHDSRRQNFENTMARLLELGLPSTMS